MPPSPPHRAALSSSLGADLAAAFRLAPYLWASFYQRARLVQMRPAPVAPYLNLEITRDCCFQCSFCLAAGRRGGPHHLDPAHLERWLPGLDGLDRVVLLGGEPLMHPELERILAATRRIGARAEIYTNGALLGRSPADIASRLVELGRLGAGRSGPGIVTLAVDLPHREQLGEAALGRLLTGARAAQDSGRVTIRFNITDPRIESRRYLSPTRAERILAEIHPELPAWLRAALTGGDVAQQFDFNPVLRMGRAADDPLSGELLRGTDLLYRPELSAAMDEDHGLRLYTLLNALWIEPRLQAICHGSVDGSSQAARDARATLRRDVLAPALGLTRDDLPNLDPLLAWLLDAAPRAAARQALQIPSDPTLEAARSALEAEPDEMRAQREVSATLRARHRYRKLVRWATPDGLDDEQARLLSHLLEDEGPDLALSDAFHIPRLPLPRLRPVIQAYHDRFPARRDRLLGELATWLLRSAAGHLLVSPSTDEDDWSPPVPPAEAAVDTGVSPLPSARAPQRLRPRWIARPGAGLSLDLEGLTVEPARSRSTEGREQDWRAVLSAIAAALPAKERVQLAATLGQSSALPAIALAALAPSEGAGAHSAPAPIPEDPVRVFEALTYEPNQHKVPWDDRALADLLARHGLPGWPDESVGLLLEHLDPPEAP